MQFLQLIVYPSIFLLSLGDSFFLIYIILLLINKFKKKKKKRKEKKRSPTDFNSKTIILCCQRKIQREHIELQGNFALNPYKSQIFYATMEKYILPS